jgi:cytochrome P450
MPKPIPGIPYNTFGRYFPWGDMGTLGIYIWITGEVFRWFSLQCLNKRSPLVQLFVPSWSMTHPTLLLADLREIEDVVTRRMGEIDRADMMHTWFGVIVPKATLGLKSKNSNFREQRRLWNVLLSPRFMEEVAAERFWEIATKLADIWMMKAELSQHNLAFEAHGDIKFATLDGIWKINVGSELGLLNATKARLEESLTSSTTWSGTATFTKIEMPEFYLTLQKLLVILDWVMTGISPRVYRWFFEVTGMLPHAIQEKEEILDRCIAASRERIQRDLCGEDAVPSCALDEVLRKDLVLNTGNAGESEATTNAALRDELLELLITGHETTTSSIAWALKYLTDQPDVQDHLRASLHAAFPHRGSSNLPSAKDIFDTPLPYLDAVISETLRLSNTAPVSFRETVVQCDILGHTVPAGTPIILVTAGPSYQSPQMVDTPEYLRSKTSQAKALTVRESTNPKASQSPHATFDPSRWLREDGSFNPDAVQSLPFSAGPRGCFGKKIALLELKIMLVVMIMRFEFPRLRKGLSAYTAKDGLNRRPTCCYVMPRTVDRAVVWEKVYNGQCVVG